MKLFYLCGLLTIITLNLLCPSYGKSWGSRLRLRPVRDTGVDIDSNKIIEALQTVGLARNEQPTKIILQTLTENIKQSGAKNDTDWITTIFKDLWKKIEYQLKNAKDDEVYIYFFFN